MQGWIWGEAARSFWSGYCIKQFLPALRKAAPKEGTDLSAPIESCSPIPMWHWGQTRLSIESTAFWTLPWWTWETSRCTWGRQPVTAGRHNSQITTVCRWSGIDVRNPTMVVETNKCFVWVLCWPIIGHQCEQDQGGGVWETPQCNAIVHIQRDNHWAGSIIQILGLRVTLYKRHGSSHSQIDCWWEEGTVCIMLEMQWSEHNRSGSNVSVVRLIGMPSTELCMRGVDRLYRGERVATSRTST